MNLYQNQATGVRGATLPGVTKELMRTSVQADYQRVKEISSKALDIMKDADEIRIETPSGTDLTLDMKEEYARKLTGNLQEDGDFGNIPSGEVFGPGLNAEGTLVIDNLAPAPDAEGTVLEIENNKVVEINSPQENDLEKKLGSIEGARNIAEFGLGTNPKAEIIGNMMNDEKVLGTVHIAFGDNEFFLPEGDERIVEADIHWDAICIDPTVYFGDELMIDEGEPVFLDD
jgi:leucyl aminopeptidase (aminopeptidase T)